MLLLRCLESLKAFDHSFRIKYKPDQLIGLFYNNTNLVRHKRFKKTINAFQFNFNRIMAIIVSKFCSLTVFKTMSNADSSFSKSQMDLLKQFKKQISNPQATEIVKTESKAQIKATAQDIQTSIQNEVDDADLFKKALLGVKKIDNSNIAKIERPNARKKPDAKTLAKRAAAEGAFESNEAELSDTQAMLNPVASQATLSYRIATLQHKVFEDLKAGNLRWYEAVDLHGCTVEEARVAVLQIIQIAKDENQTVIKIVHGKGPDAVLKTYVNGWLRQHRDVLAFVSAPENQGGTGAVLVLLKRAEKNPKFTQG